jgi:predicted amino acid dehydrogenase
MTEEQLDEAYKILNKEKEEYLKANPDFEPDGDFWDSHSCSMFADEYGYCQFCGAVVYGSFAYCELHGCDMEPCECEEYSDYDDSDIYIDDY